MPKTTQKETSSVLIVDDQPIVRRGFAMILAGQSDLDLCGAVANHSEAYFL